jgi:hypothetical protein
MLVRCLSVTSFRHPELVSRGAAARHGAGTGFALGGAGWHGSRWREPRANHDTVRKFVAERALVSVG